MTDVLLRKAVPADIGQLVELCQLHAEYEGATYDPMGKAEKLAQVLVADPAVLHCLVAVSGSTLLGYATATKEFSTWDADYYLHMDCLYLRAEARGLGLGTQFINQLKALARQLNCSHLQWQTPANNDKAIAFYHQQQARSKDKKRFYLDAGAEE